MYFSSDSLGMNSHLYEHHPIFSEFYNTLSNFFRILQHIIQMRWSHGCHLRARSHTSLPPQILRVVVCTVKIIWWYHRWVDADRSSDRSHRTRVTGGRRVLSAFPWRGCPWPPPPARLRSSPAQPCLDSSPLSPFICGHRVLQLRFEFTKPLPTLRRWLNKVLVYTLMLPPDAHPLLRRVPSAKARWLGNLNPFFCFSLCF